MGFSQNLDTIPVSNLRHWSCNWIFFTLQHVIWSFFSALRWISATILASVVAAFLCWWLQHRTCKEMPTMLIYMERRRKQWKVHQTSKYTLPSLPWTSASTSPVRKSILTIPLPRERKALHRECEIKRKLNYVCKRVQTNFGILKYIKRNIVRLNSELGKDIFHMHVNDSNVSPRRKLHRHMLFNNRNLVNII